MSPDSTGITLARGLHADLVAPLLARELPGLGHAAGRLGSGSDVLGLDDETSRDHDWGCRLTLLLDDADAAAVSHVDGLLARELPESYCGWPMRFATTWDPSVRHRVEVSTIGEFAVGRLGVDPTRGMSTVDWLMLSGQRVLEVTAGPLFVDGTGRVSRLRRRLRWYPPDLDRYVLAAGWDRLAAHVPTHGRTGERGQRLQSALLGAALAAEVIRLAFLVSQAWIPYDKWVEALFRRLPVADRLPVETLHAAADWREREAALGCCVEVLLATQRERGQPGPDVGLVPFYDRAYRTIAPEVTGLLRTGITSPRVRALPPPLGTAAQWTTDVVVSTSGLWPALRGAYHVGNPRPVEPPGGDNSDQG
jgi:hypothetical protein